MHRRDALRNHALRITALALLINPLARPVAGQERLDPAAELAVGSLVFPDDGSANEGFVGGAVRFHVRPRISVGPEVAYIRGDNHNHLMLTGNVTFDLLPPIGGGSRRVTPFVVAGAGLFHTRESFPNNQTFTHTEGAFTAGGGVRALVGRRFFVGAEARIGWELHIRLNGLAGVRVGA